MPIFYQTDPMQAAKSTKQDIPLKLQRPILRQPAYQHHRHEGTELATGVQAMDHRVKALGDELLTPGEHSEIPFVCATQ
jgi:hypothetical protein